MSEKTPYRQHHAIANSDLDSLAISRQHMLINRAADNDTPATMLGTAAHSYILEGKANFVDESEIRLKFAENAESFDRKKGLYQSWKKKQARLIVDDEDLQFLTNARKRFLENKFVQSLYAVEQPLVETEIFFDWCGVQCKSKIDLIFPMQKTIVDLKTIEDISEIDSPYFFRKSRYDRQMCFYSKACLKEFGVNHRTILLFAEKKAPYSILPREIGLYQVMQNVAWIENVLQNQKEMPYETLQFLGFQEEEEEQPDITGEM